MNEQAIPRLIFLFTEVRRIIIEHNFKNFLRCIEGILSVLYDEDCPVEDKIREVKSIYKNIVGRHSGLDDWGISLEDKEKECQINKYFHNILDEIWDLLGFYEDNFPDFIHVLNNKREFKDFKNDFEILSHRYIERMIQLTFERSPSPEHIKKCAELKTLLAQRKE